MLVVCALIAHTLVACVPRDWLSPLSLLTISTSVVDLIYQPSCQGVTIVSP